MENTNPKLFYNIHTHRRPGSSDEICIRNSFLLSPEKIEAKYYLSSGLHPWFVHQYSLPELRKRLIKNVRDPRILAIGEIGLDKLKPEFDKQKEVLDVQLEIASEKKLPVIVHLVKSNSEIIPFLNQFNEYVVLHGFTQGMSVWEQLNRRDKTCISIGSAAIQGSDKLRDLIKNIPIDRLFLETDNANIPIREIYQCVADIRSIALKELILHIEQNFKRVFLSGN